jgi:hypothetical protein
MYYGNNKHYVESHDDTKLKSAKTVKLPDGSYELHVVYVLKEGGDYSDVRFLHSTNGVDHRLDPVEVVLPEAKESKKK